jgi:hypothetical protein
MKHPQETALPLLKIVFPEELGSALVLASYIPRRILEVSLMKISAFLNPQNNKQYFFSRMTTQFAGKETLLKDILGQIELKPQECLPHIEEGGDFSCFFWPAFCATIRIGLKKKNEFTASDISVFQATFIIEFFSGYYRSITMREKERETALKEIELKIEKAPYAYTLKDILQFTDAVGRPLTDFYTQTDLDGFLNTRAFFGGVPEAGSPLPPLLVFRNRNDEQVFISKGKVFPMLIELLGEVRPQVQKAIESRWDKFIRDFENEAAMENDRDFEKLVTQCAVELAPMLMMILDDKKLFLVQEELTAAQGGTLDNSSRVYQDDGTLTPLSKLLSINRKDLLTDVKIQLPFWYNVPIIFSILGFFKRLRDKKPKSQPPRQEVPHEKERARPAKPVQDIKRAAEDYHAQMVPSGKTADAYLQELEDRWRKVIDAAAKKQLVQDVRSQIKHRLKPVLDARGNRKVTSKTIEEMADAVIMVSPAFAKLGNSNDIRAYVALYIAKLLKQ